MIKVLTSAIVFILVLSIPVLAQETTSPGILPDNPVYPVKLFFERVRIVLTFNSEAKARLRAALAEKRLVELNATIAKGKLQYVEGLKERYENEMVEAERLMNRNEALGRNVTALTEHVCNATYKHVSVLERVLEKAPEQAKPALERVINASVIRHENCSVKILARWNNTIEEVKRINCTADVDCRGLVCPMVIGRDTPVCENDKCKCGGKWEIINKTEWKERFKEDLTNQSQTVLKKIGEKYIEKIRERSKRPVPR